MQYGIGFTLLKQSSPINNSLVNIEHPIRNIAHGSRSKRPLPKRPLYQNGL